MKSKNTNNQYFRPREFKQNMSDLIFKRIFNLLSSGEFDIVVTNKTKGEAGYIDYENYIIYLNPKIFPIEETLVHEAIHILKPNADEKTVIEMSSLMFERLNNTRRDKLVAYIQALATKYVGIKKNDLKANYL